MRLVITKPSSTINSLIPGINVDTQRIIVRTISDSNEFISTHLPAISESKFDIKKFKKQVWKMRTKDLLKSNNRESNNFPIVIDYNRKSTYEYRYDKCEKIPEKKISTDYSNTIIFDDHGKTKLKCRKNYLYYEPYTTVDPSGYLLERLRYHFDSSDSNNNLNSIIQYSPSIYDELIEIAFTDIGIIDRRIQEELMMADKHYKAPNNNSGNRDRSNFETMESMRVYIPNPNPAPETESRPRTSESGCPAKPKYINGFKLSKDIFNNKQELMKSIKIWIKEIADRRPLDFLVIHYSIAETLYGNSEKDLNLFIQNLKEDSEVFKGEVVFTSGRGTPPSIPKHFPFIPYSSVSRYLFEQPSKYMLTKILFAAKMKGGLK